ncbi:MAG: carboxymuconolactone decarboxylase family protein [Trebonia sp.]
MARLPLLNAEDLPEEDRDVLERPINLYRLLAHLPEYARRYRAMGRWFRFESNLDPRLRELAILQVGLVTGDPYETSHHVHVGHEFGVSDAEMTAVAAETRGEPSDLGERERVVLRAARELTAGVRLPAATWDALARWLTDAERLELVALIGYYNMTVRILGASELDVEDEYLPYLSLFPEIAAERGDEA